MTLKYYRRSIDPFKQYRRWIDRRVRTLRLADVTAYLRQRGWRELPPDRKAFLVFQEPSGELVNGRPLCQFVPAFETYDDYPLRMFELITGLAEYEDRQASEVIDDILRLAGSESSNGENRSKAREADAARQ
jgi:hypothetical protein